MKRILLFLSVALSAQQAIDAPPIAQVLDAEGLLTPIHGLAGNFIAGPLARRSWRTRTMAISNGALSPAAFPPLVRPSQPSSPPMPRLPLSAVNSPRYPNPMRPCVSLEMCSFVPPTSHTRSLPAVSSLGTTASCRFYSPMARSKNSSVSRNPQISPPPPQTGSISQ
jgi:hypothetical protein